MCLILNIFIMKNLLHKLRNIESECCITVILNTHRTKPDIQKDVITLKNMLTEAEEKLLSHYNKRFVQPVLFRLKQLAEGIDHSQNLESLILFVSDDISEIVRLPVDVENRVIIGNTFATRDLVRALYQQVNYYVLVLSRDRARLIEALNDQEIREIENEFPFDNPGLYLTSDKELSKPKQKDQMIEEYFNRVDKTLFQVWKEKQLPVVVCAEERNFHHYMKMADHKDIIMAHINQSRLDEKASNIVQEAWPVIFKILEDKNIMRMSELRKAVTLGNYSSDTGEIWRALNESRGQTLFVSKNYFQTVKVLENALQVVDGSYNDEEDMIEDIVERMVEMTIKTGGDVVFLSGDELADFDNLALITRY
jgi:hypothetical protein